MCKYCFPIFLLVILNGCESPSRSASLPPVIRPLQSTLLQLLPGSVEFDSSIPGKLTALDSRGAAIGTCLYTWPLNRGARGFAGPVPVLAVLDSSERVITVLLLPNQETPEFLERLKRACFGDSWSGFSRQEASDMEIDAVSRATYSSNAVIKSVQALLKEK